MRIYIILFALLFGSYEIEGRMPSQIVASMIDAPTQADSQVIAMIDELLKAHSPKLLDDTVDLKNDGNQTTILITAIAQNRKPVVDYLLSKGANANQLAYNNTEKKQTSPLTKLMDKALEYAQANNIQNLGDAGEILKSLLTYRANPYIGIGGDKPNAAENLPNFPSNNLALSIQNNLYIGQVMSDVEENTKFDITLLKTYLTNGHINRPTVRLNRLVNEGSNTSIKLFNILEITLYYMMHDPTRREALRDVLNVLLDVPTLPISKNSADELPLPYAAIDKKTFEAVLAKTTPIDFDTALDKKGNSILTNIMAYGNSDFLKDATSIFMTKITGDKKSYVNKQNNDGDSALMILTKRLTDANGVSIGLTLDELVSSQQADPHTKNHRGESAYDILNNLPIKDDLKLAIKGILNKIPTPPTPVPPQEIINKLEELNGNLSSIKKLL